MNDHLKKYRGVLVAVLIFTAIAVTAVVAGRSVGNSRYSRAETMMHFSGKIDGEGNAHFPDTAGNEVVIAGNVKQAERTADEQHIITLYQSGELVLMDGNGDRLWDIDDEVKEIYTVRDTGFIYEKAQSDTREFYRYLYEADSVQCLGNGDFMPADYTLDLIVYDAGRIFLITEGDTGLEEIATYDEGMEIELIDIAEGGKLAAWAEIDDNIHYIYIEDKGEVFC